MSGTGITGPIRARLRARVRAESRRPPQPEVAHLVGALRARFGGHFVAALYYGSCRLQAQPEGLVDLHVLLDDPAAVLGPVAAGACAVLPPNVHYLEVEYEGRTLRCKYAVLSATRMRGLCTRRGFHSYFWARYAQPMSVITDDPRVRASIEESLVDALATLFSRALPRVDDGSLDALELWVRTLVLCYHCELRPEGGTRARTLIDAQSEYFAATGAAILDDRTTINAAATPALVRASWILRRVWGKWVSLLRLLKALHTFEGGLDYAAWKLERHSGRRIEIPDAVRRRPWLHLWPHLWRLWREGVLR